MTLSDLERSKSMSFRYCVIEECYSVNIYFLVVFDINLDVTLCSLLAAGFSAVPAVFLVDVSLYSDINRITIFICRYKWCFVIGRHNWCSTFACMQIQMVFPCTYKCFSRKFNQIWDRYCKSSKHSDINR